MSEQPEYNSSWTVSDAELGDRIDASINLVSSSSSSRSQSSLNINLIENDAALDDSETTKLNLDPAPISKSCDDLLQNAEEKSSTFLRSQSCQSLNSNQSQSKGKYDHVQSKIKQYIKVLNEPSPREKGKTLLPTAIPSTSTKEEYLEEINHRLSRELEEKNVVLLQLQENYEHLLLKYAEAQNKIDNLRLKTMNVSEPSHRSRARASSFRMNFTAPPVYPFKIADVKERDNSPFTKNEISTDTEVRADRPTTLAVEPGLRVSDKAVTPTDSEGVSSVITSMSGHSKILTNFDDGNNEGEGEKKATLKSEVLESALPVNDPIDKVKNWQNSLPPLEFIETPDNALYDVDVEPVTTPSTRYNEITELGKIPEASEEWSVSNAKTVSQAVMKKYLRTLSLPSSLTRRNMLAQIYKRRSNHTIDLSSPLHVDCPSEGALATDLGSPKNPDQPAANIIQRRKKRPPFLRSASLPIYEYDSPRSGVRNSVPPLDFDNLTFSEGDSSPVSKSNIITTPSFVTSHDYSFQTLNSLNSCKATVSDYSGSSTSRVIKPAIHKSTSITPDRSKNMIFSESSDILPGPEDGGNCNICGESVISMKSVSYQGIHNVQSQEWSPGVTSIGRSVSFNSESSSQTNCTHKKHITDQDSVETFEVYSRDLKARSQIIMKALSAHVHNT